MKTRLLLTLLWLSVLPAHALDMTRPATVQVTVRDNAAGVGRYETRAPSLAPDIFWTEHLRVTLAGYAPCDGDIRFFPGEQGDLPVILFPPAKPSRQRFEDPPSGLPPRPLRLTLRLPDGSPASGWSVGPNAYVASSYSFIAGVVLPPVYVYALDTPVAVDKLGVVQLNQSEGHLLVISPQGLPLLYPLRPQAWPAGLHSVTLRLPAVRVTKTAQVALPDGKPAAGFPVRVAQATTGGQQWQVTLKQPIGMLQTDAAGRCPLPQYFGTRYQYESRRPPLSAYDLATPGGSALHDYSEPALKPSEYKDITLKFAGADGKILPGIALSEEKAYQNGKLISDVGGAGTIDRNGVHLFLPIAAARVTITAQEPGWNTLSKTLLLTGDGDQALAVTLPPSLRLKPLSGVLLDPLGRPVPGAAMPLCAGIDPHSGNTNNDFLQFSTTTDARGRFAFAAAPDSCEIDLYRFGADKQPNLPGWIEPPLVTPQARHLVIRLKPFLPTAVRVLLPPSVVVAPKEVYLKSAAKGDADLPAYLFPAFDPKTHTLLWSRIPPGAYTLTAGDGTLPAAARLALPVALQAHGETRIDLRSKAASFPSVPAPVVVTIHVTDTSGRAVSGATVTLWTNREAEDRDRDLPADLTDDGGAVRLPLGAGERGVAVAHAAGRLIGWTSLTGQAGETVSVSALPAQTLTVPLPPLPLVDGRPPYDARSVTLTLSGLNPMKPDEAQAVFLVLGLLPPSTGFLGDGPAPTITLFPEPDGVCTAEDLPPGMYHLEAGRNVTLAFGEAASEIRLP